MYASITASGDALATITIPRRSRLLGVLWSIEGNTLSDADSVKIELSVNSARQVATNDATGIISVASSSVDVTTSGAVKGETNFFHPVDLQFEDGDKLYLHCTEVGTGIWNTRALLYFS